MFCNEGVRSSSAMVNWVGRFGGSALLLVTHRKLRGRSSQAEPQISTKAQTKLRHSEEEKFILRSQRSNSNHLRDTIEVHNTLYLMYINSFLRLERCRRDECVTQIG